MMINLDYSDCAKPATIEDPNIIPWRDRSVTLILLAETPMWAHWHEGKRKILADGRPVLLAWNGSWRTEVFKLDDVSRALAIEHLRKD
jgi:hypothetical protein